MITIAVMQPYFIPYAGYFQLFAACDLFVLYDCVQFPRRGWVHRNRLANRLGSPDWLTLPLRPAARDVRIAELAFADDAAGILARRARRFPALDAAVPLVQSAMDPSGSPVDLIERTLATACRELQLGFNTVRSSTLGIDATLHGEQRILAICRALGAGRYVNPSGGRSLYDGARFAAAGIELRFLAPYRGSDLSILQRLHDERATVVGAEIRGQVRLEQ